MGDPHIIQYESSSTIEKRFLGFKIFEKHPEAFLAVDVPRIALGISLALSYIPVLDDIIRDRHRAMGGCGPGWH